MFLLLNGLKFDDWLPAANGNLSKIESDNWKSYLILNAFIKLTNTSQKSIFLAMINIGDVADDSLQLVEWKDF